MILMGILFTKSGAIRRSPHKTLLDCVMGKKVKIESILDQSVEFLNFAKKKKLMPGKMIIVHNREKIADTVELQIEKNPTFSLGFLSADKILVTD